MTRPTKPVYPTDVWKFMQWAKVRGVLVSLETTSAHGGTDVKIWIRTRPDYYDAWTEKTQFGMGAPAFERWYRMVEELIAEAPK